ncbi:MAG: hypothetical protein J1F69_00265 [Clostridiales bacterium]|nr:hypothetical protein [Clostridiales bacterium]
MSDKIVEQAEKSASKIGKFNTAEDLLAAYNALESEFTKRCQLLKQLQTELDSIRAQAAQSPQTDDAPAPETDTRPVPEAEAEREKDVVPTAPPAISDDVLNAILQNARDYADVLSAIPEVMSACIARYKQRLIRPYPAPAPAGMAVIVPTERPKTLSDAKRLADALLAGN